VQVTFRDVSRSIGSRDAFWQRQRRLLPVELAQKSAGIKSPNFLSPRFFPSLFLPSRRFSRGTNGAENTKNRRHQMA
jgi:hypothetical protein